MLNPLHLRALAAVLRTGSFAAAALQLGSAPSAVSQQVFALEPETQLVLFECAVRSVRPTQATELLAQGSGEVLALLDALQDDVDRLAVHNPCAVEGLRTRPGRRGRPFSGPGRGSYGRSDDGHRATPRDQA